MNTDQENLFEMDKMENMKNDAPCTGSDNQEMNLKLACQLITKHIRSTDLYHEMFGKPSVLRAYNYLQETGYLSVDLDACDERIQTFASNPIVND